MDNIISDVSQYINTEQYWILSATREDGSGYNKIIRGESKADVGRWIKLHLDQLFKEDILTGILEIDPEGHHPYTPYRNPFIKKIIDDIKNQVPNFTRMKQLLDYEWDSIARHQDSLQQHDVRLVFKIVKEHLLNTSDADLVDRLHSWDNTDKRHQSLIVQGPYQIENL